MQIIIITGLCLLGLPGLLVVLVIVGYITSSERK